MDDSDNGQKPPKPQGWAKARVDQSQIRDSLGRFESPGPVRPRDYRTDQRREVNKRARERFFSKPGNRARYSLRSRLARYGLTEQQFADLRARHNGRCAICNTTLTSDQTSTGEHIDHDHATGRVRGLLCVNHNTALGKFDDSSAMLRCAASYVDGIEVDPDCF